MAGSLTDIFAAMQNGVVALGNFKRQLTGSFNNISGQLTTLTSAIAGAALSSTVPTIYVRTIAGNSSAFTLNAASGITNSTNDILLSQASTSQFGAVKVDGSTITAAAGVISAVSSRANLTPITAFTSADIALSNTASYFDGPSVAQGSSGTWFASGSVTLVDPGTTTFHCKLWDGTTVMDSAAQSATATFDMCVALSGFLASPAGNIRISCRDVGSSNGLIKFNITGSSRDSAVTAIRVA